MSKITNEGLIRSGTGCFMAVPIPYGNSGRQRVRWDTAAKPNISLAFCG